MTLPAHNIRSILRSLTPSTIRSRMLLPAYILLLSLSIIASASDFSVRGYIKETPLWWKPQVGFYSDNSRRFDNLLHTRQNFRYYANDVVDFGLELKTRLYTGQSALEMQSAAESFTFDERYFDWKRNFIEKDNAVLSCEIDRLWMNIEKDDLLITIGRQRIAWGTNLVWNVTDLFNPSSPLDFDNEEMPGTDAVRLQYYTGVSSKMEIAYKPATESGHSTGALLYKFNRYDYDFHFMAGYREEDAVCGFAWAGQIYGGGFRGEFLANAPDIDDNPSDMEASAAISGDYTFKNSLYLHAEALYYSAGTAGKAGGLLLYRAYMNRILSPAKYSLFGEIAKDMTPLLRTDISGIFNPYDKSFYIGPSMMWSVITNLDFTASAMFFGGGSGTEYGDKGEIIMGMLKWSF